MRYLSKRYSFKKYNFSWRFEYPILNLCKFNDNNSDMKKFSVLLFAAATFLLASCDYQKTNVIEQKDVRHGDEWVYGVSPDSAARQLKNKYTPKPELEQRTNAIREKMFGAGKVNEGA